MNLSILYTANIRGDLDMLPRLYTFIKEVRRDVLRFRPEDEDVMLCAVQPPEVRTLLIDLGNSCAPDVWHCAATGGRSTLIALDAMGYHAANVGDLSPESLDKLHENLMSMALVNRDQPWQQDKIILSAEPNVPPLYEVERGLGGEDASPHIQILLSPADRTHIDGRTLYLAAVRAGQIGSAYISSLDTKPVLSAHAIFDLPPNTPPDPTIAGAVDFITREARVYQRKQV